MRVARVTDGTRNKKPATAGFLLLLFMRAIRLRSTSNPN